MQHFPTNIYSETGQLEAVLIHTPGAEVENMTPENAERALYSDILNLSIIRQEYEQFRGVLKRFANTFEVMDLLRDILEMPDAKLKLVTRICQNEMANCIRDSLLDMDADRLAAALIEGVLLDKNNLTGFLSKERYSLKPVHNFFFTRDAAVSIYDQVFIGAMASPVRLREAVIMEAIFQYHPAFGSATVNPASSGQHGIAIEGGDVLIARDDVLICGIGSRTTPQGVDFIMKHLKGIREKQHILVQELPLSPESFIHLDMVFTLLDRDVCMIYEPVIVKSKKFQTVYMYAEGGKVKTIRQEENLLTGLRKLGFSLHPVPCGGPDDAWIQEREQWHSGANFFALAPGRILGYARNTHTAEALTRHGFEILSAKDVLSGKKDPFSYSRCLIAIDGSELPRGGGGPRCMTMPISRKKTDR